MRLLKESTATNLDEFYKELCECQQDAHGEDYIAVHAEIAMLLSECESYTEFGIMQGTTLAVPLLVGTKKIRAYDIDLSRFNKFKHFFVHDDFKVYETDTANCTIDPVDLLYIDSCHTAKHLKKELNRHADKANKYIVLHDTSHKPELYDTAVQFCTSNPDWTVKTRSTVNVGYTTLERLT